MKKKHNRFKWPKNISKQTKLIILPIMGFVALGAIILAILAIIIIPFIDSGSKFGVGADGFTAFSEDGTSLGLEKLVTKEEVATALGNKARFVGEQSTSKVFNLDGNRAQTVTYALVRSDGVKASLYVDLMIFKNKDAFDDAKVLKNVIEAGKVNGQQAYFMHALTWGSDREYRLMIVDGNKVYKLALVQPFRDIEISEVSAMAVLKTLAGKIEF